MSVRAGAHGRAPLLLLSLALGVLVPDGAARASTQVIFNGGGDTPSTSTSDYTTIMGLEDGVWEPTLSEHEGIVSTAGSLARLRVLLSAAPGAGKSYSFTLMKNGAASGLACTVSGTATSCADTTNTVALAAGDAVALRALPVGSPTTTRVSTSMTFDGATPAESIYVGGTGSGTLSNTTDRRVPVHGIYQDGATPVARWQTDVIAPTSGNFRKLYVRLSAAPGAGASRAFALEVNDLATSVGCTIAGSATACSNTALFVSVVPGDTVRVLESPSVTNPVSATVQLGVVFVADNDGEFLLVQSGAAALSSTAVNFTTPSAGHNAVANTVESDHVVLAQTSTVKRMFANLNGPPGAGTSYRLNLRVNGADTAIGCTMADSATTCNATVDIPLFDGDLLANKSTPAGGPTVRSARITYLLSTGTAKRARRVWYVE